MLTEEERAQLQKAIHNWAERAPDPDCPVMGFLGADLMSPAQIDDAIQSGSEDGDAFLEVLEHGVRREGLRSVVERFYSAVESPAT